MGALAKKETTQNYLWSDIIRTYESLWDDLHAQSVSYTGDIPVLKNPFANDYLYAFNHYPTGILGKECVCTITTTGNAALQSGTIPIPYTDISSLLDNNAILAILKLLSQAKYSLIHITHNSG
jgi:hypothetical protein